ncbi:MAG: PBP1A family penicillin-binding protein [Candidatus Magasanikbacteria bacterium]
MPIPHLQKRIYGYVRRSTGREPKQGRPPRSPKRRFKGLKKRLVLGLIIAGVLGFLFLTVLVAWTSKDLPNPDRLLDSSIAQSTKIYDRTGEHLLYEIFAQEKRTIIEFEEVPKDLVNGVIATEDTKFYEHKGIRPLSILRAFVYGVFTNKRISGTSTLTQQLVKNAILTNERSLTRKIKEAILSIRLEQKYTKDQILKIYFNEIPYGSTNYGVEAAAQSYFGKHVSDLTLAESATLAGFPKAPSKYLNDPDSLKQRRDFVLRRMFEEGYITEEQKNTAQAEALTLTQHYGEIKAPHFVLHVKQLLIEQYGLEESKVEKGGLKVITTLDWDKQQIAEKVISEDSLPILEKAEADNAALVALDPKTGQILALVGSRDFNNDEIKGKFNVVTQGKRQPGSSFKPIIYSAAFEKGYTPDTILFDVTTNFAMSGKPYTPQNYDGKEYGPLTMRQALQGSLNIPAVQTLYLVGPKKGVEFAQRLGYTTLNEGEFGLTLVLGGGEVKLLEHTNAYATFANNGLQHTPTAVLKIEDPTGKTLYEWKKDNGKRVIEPEIAATISNVLSDDGARSYIFGANGILTLPGRPVAVKTGTTNNYVDTWTVGFTPSLVTGIWVGNTDNTPMKFGNSSAAVAAPLWNSFMKQSLEGTPVEQFPTPPANDADKPILRGSLGGSIKLLVDKATGKRASSSTPENLIEEKTFIPPHSVLHYVQKEDPRGDPPTNPADDPQYERWEASIQDWIKRKKEQDPNWNVSFEEPPTEYDDEHSLELIPMVEILSPTEGQILTDRRIITSIIASAPRGVTQVTYKIDGVYVGVITQHPFNLDYTAENLDSGEHTLTVIVEDDIRNRAEKDIKFLLNTDPLAPGVTFSKSLGTMSVNSFPQTLYLDYHKLNEIEETRLYIKKDGSNDKQLVTKTDDFSNMFNSQLVLNWNTAPDKGSYDVILEVVAQGGDTRESDKQKIIIN